MSHLPLRTVMYILNEFEKMISKYSFKVYLIDDNKKVVLLEDSLALYIGIEEDKMPVCLNAAEVYSWALNNDYMDIPSKDVPSYCLAIEELTYNSLGFKYNHSKFLCDLEKKINIPYLSTSITYTKFRGYTRLYWCLEQPTLAEMINEQLPELYLRDRYDAWEGINYYLIVIELDDIDGDTAYAVAYTTQKPDSYIISRCREWIKTGRLDGDMRRNYLEFQEAFQSWKGMRRQERLENHMRYFYFEKRFREKNDVWKCCDEILANASKNLYATEERSTYLRPINKWISEEQVFKLTKRLYKEYNVIYQHRPFFLRSSRNGQMSYDVFISGLNIAIEYQGKQHFEPVEYFGGDVAFKNTVQRDKEKLELSIQNNIKLIYINYWEIISEKLIKEKVDNLNLSVPSI